MITQTARRFRTRCEVESGFQHCLQPCQGLPYFRISVTHFGGNSGLSTLFKEIRQGLLGEVVIG